MGRSENLGFFGMKTALRRSSFAAQAAQAQPLTWDRPEIRLKMAKNVPAQGTRAPEFRKKGPRASMLDPASKLKLLIWISP